MTRYVPVAVLFIACSADAPDKVFPVTEAGSTGGTGGATITGGASSAGGLAGTGGTTTTGGADSTGGATQTDAGQGGTGGTLATGGAIATGGAGTGGTVSLDSGSDGADGWAPPDGASSGGTAGTGGVTNTGGTSATGGQGTGGQTCECSSGPCCDGCKFTPAGDLCRSFVATSQCGVNANPNACVTTTVRPIYFDWDLQYCSGVSAVCDGAIEDWRTIQSSCYSPGTGFLGYCVTDSATAAHCEPCP